MTTGRAGEDQRHFSEIEEELRVKSNIILCFPMLLPSGKVYGAVELIDTRTGADQITIDEDYLQLIDNIVNIGSLAVGNHIAYHAEVEKTEELERVLNDMREPARILGQSQCLLSILDKVRSYARVDYPVFITGESGTGKELFAEELHRLSNRNGKPYLVQNCSAIPETLLESELFGHMKGAFTDASTDKIGLFEAADGGTLFLDEIGDMPLNLQARILRFLQNGEIKPLGSTVTKKLDVRIISATNRDLTQAITMKEFREDLYYRLNVLPLHIPPLRDRKEDIPILLESFLNRESRRLGMESKPLSQEAIDVLVGYSWKGNIRELENLVRHLMVVAEGPTIALSDLPVHLTQGSHLENPEGETGILHGPAGAGAGKPGAFEDCTWEALERDYVCFLLETYHWNITQCAKHAGVNRSTFDSRMRRLGIRRES
jgi:transcriptional regulator with GAF, ATPase, and Fis domain